VSLVALLRSGYSRPGVARDVIESRHTAGVGTTQTACLVEADFRGRLAWADAGNYDAKTSVDDVYSRLYGGDALRSCMMLSGGMKAPVASPHFCWGDVLQAGDGICVVLGTMRRRTTRL
jgi:hypothetical protein